MIQRLPSLPHLPTLPYPTPKVSYTSLAQAKAKSLHIIVLYQVPLCILHPCQPTSRYINLPQEQRRDWEAALGLDWTGDRRTLDFFRRKFNLGVDWIWTEVDTMAIIFYRCLEQWKKGVHISTVFGDFSEPVCLPIDAGLFVAFLLSRSSPATPTIGTQFKMNIVFTFLKPYSISRHAMQTKECVGKWRKGETYTISCSCSSSLLPRESL